MSDALHILFTTRLSREAQQQIQAISPRIKLAIHNATAAEDIPRRAWERAEILFSGDILPSPEMETELKWIHSPYAGVDNLLEHPFMQAHPEITLTSSSGIHATKMGEYVMAMILAMAHRIPTMLKHQEKALWSEDRYKIFMPTELSRATVGILGYGSIGREVARLAHTFNMTILATKNNLKTTTDTGYTPSEGIGDTEGEIADRFYPPEATGFMVKDCDFVVVALPLTEQTRNSYNQEIIEKMKPGSYLINVGRGGIVDEEALIKALESGHVAGAALDVFNEEPLPLENPLWKAPNVIISPHISGNMVDYKRKALNVFEANLRRYVENNTLLNIVNRELGY